VHSEKPRNTTGNLPNTMKAWVALHFNRAVQEVSKYSVRKEVLPFRKTNNRFDKVIIENLKEIVEITKLKSIK
jgi:hypothetical protein